MKAHAETLWEGQGYQAKPTYRARCPLCGTMNTLRFNRSGTLKQAEGCLHYSGFDSDGSAGEFMAFSRMPEIENKNGG